MAKPIYITTPIYYVNAQPHIGHAYTTIAADLMARWHKLAGRDVFFLTGTDEHGNKIAEAAAAQKISPQELTDRVAMQFEAAWRALDIDHDYFIRTTSERHAQAVRKILDAMRNARTPDGQEVIYSGYYEGLYCTGCEKFLTEKDLVDGKCPDHGTVPEALKEKNYFFRLSAYLPQVKEAILSGRVQILPEEKRNEVLGLIDQELTDFSLSRERVSWGIPLSFDPSQVAYVWIDALSNYISGIGYADDETHFRKWWTDGHVIHLLGKEILKFHCIWWPAMLLAAGERMPDEMFLHGWFTVDGQKMSKSLGNAIDPHDMVGQFGADGTRYLLMTQYPFGIDGDIQASRFVTQYNADLANDLGNLVSRVIKLLAANLEGVIPAVAKGIDGQAELQAQAVKTADSAYEHIIGYRPQAAIAEGIALVRATNRFFNDTTPWKSAKAGEMERLGGILRVCLEALRIVSITLYPILPSKMTALRTMLGCDDSTLTLEHARAFWGLQEGTVLTVPEPLFPRLETKRKAEEAAPKASPESSESDGLIDISHFGKVQLRVAEVVAAESVPKADKLLRLQVALGSEQRQIVAGIAQHYSPDDLIGKRVVIVANLKPATIRGVESHGMLLAAKAGKRLVVVTVDGDLDSGASVS